MPEGIPMRRNPREMQKEASDAVFGFKKAVRVHQKARKDMILLSGYDW